MQTQSDAKNKKCYLKTCRVRYTIVQKQMAPRRTSKRSFDDSTLDKKKIAEIMKRSVEGYPNKRKTPFTENDREIVRLHTMIHKDHLMPIFESPEKVIKKMIELNQNSAGQYISLFSTFLRRLGAQDLCIPQEKLNDILKSLCLAVKEKRKPSRDAREKGNISERERKRDVHVLFPELQERAKNNWYDELIPLFAKIDNIKMKEHSTLLRGTLMSLYTSMPNIRSKWHAILDQSFDIQTEDGLLLGNKGILIFNKDRKMQKG